MGGCYPFSLIRREGESVYIIDVKFIGGSINEGQLTISIPKQTYVSHTHAYTHVRALSRSRSHAHCVCVCARERECLRVFLPGNETRHWSTIAQGAQERMILSHLRNS